MLGEMGNSHPVTKVPKDIIGKKNKHYKRDMRKEAHEDIAAFQMAQDVAFQSFIGGREAHGNHFEKGFMYSKSVLYEKCMRFKYAHDHGIELDREELDDLASTASMVRSFDFKPEERGEYNEKQI